MYPTTGVLPTTVARGDRCGHGWIVVNELAVHRLALRLSNTLGQLAINPKNLSPHSPRTYQPRAAPSTTSACSDCWKLSVVWLLIPKALSRYPLQTYHARTAPAQRGCARIVQDYRLVGF